MTETPSSPSIGETVSDAVQEVYAACAALRENVSSLSSRDLRSALAAIEASSRAIRDGKGANVSRDALERLAGVVKGTIEIGERAVWENSGASAKHDKESEVLSRMDAWAEKTESETEEKRIRSTSIGRSSWLEIDAERAQEDARRATTRESRSYSTTAHAAQSDHLRRLGVRARVRAPVPRGEISHSRD